MKRSLVFLILCAFLASVLGSCAPMMPKENPKLPKNYQNLQKQNAEGTQTAPAQQPGSTEGESTPPAGGEETPGEQPAQPETPPGDQPAEPPSGGE